MSSIQVLKSYDCVVISEHKTVKELQKWLDENCYTLFERSLHLKESDERVWIKYNDAEPSANIQKTKELTIKNVLDISTKDSFIRILDIGNETEVYNGHIKDIPKNAYFLNYEISYISFAGGIACIYY